VSNRRRIRRPKDGPGRFTVRHPLGTYLVRYPHSAQFTVTGQLGETWGGSIGRNPVIVQEDGQVMILDPRAIITLDSQRLYGPRDLPADDHSADMRAWLIEHPRLGCATVSSTSKATGPAARAMMAARAARAAEAAARPKVRKARKRRKPPGTKMDTVRVTPAPPQPAPRGMDELAQLGQRLRLEPIVAQRRAELDELAALMSSTPGRR
jgi:hypothetical protein